MQLHHKRKNKEQFVKYNTIYQMSYHSRILIKLNIIDIATVPPTINQSFWLKLGWALEQAGTVKYVIKFRMLS